MAIYESLLLRPGSLEAHLDRLDSDDRARLAMRAVAGFDSNELAVALGISPSGTRNRLERLGQELSGWTSRPPSIG